MYRCNYRRNAIFKPSIQLKMEAGRSSDTSRDQRRDVHTLRAAGLSNAAIAAQLQLTDNQVQYAATHPATPKKRSGRRPALTAAQIEELLEFIMASKEGRRMPYCQLPVALG